MILRGRHCAFIFLIFVLGVLATVPVKARAEMTCDTIPSNVREVFVNAYRYHKTLAARPDGLESLYALRLSYGYLESHLYALASNDETSELDGLEVSQDLMRVDNGKSLRGKRRASLASYREIFDGQGDYTLRVGGFPTRKGYRLKGDGALWARGDVVRRFATHASTDFGFLQMSPDQGGRMSELLSWVIRQSALSENAAREAVTFCDAGLVYKDRASRVAAEYHRLARSCSPWSGGPAGHLCFGRWVTLCPRYSVLLGVTASPQYFASGTRRDAVEVCREYFR